MKRSEELRDDREVVMTAIKYYFRNYECASEKLQKDPKILKATQYYEAHRFDRLS